MFIFVVWFFFFFCIFLFLYFIWWVVDGGVFVRSFESRVWLLITVVVISNIDDGVAWAPGKNEIVSVGVVSVFGECNGMDAVDDGCGDGEFCPTATGDSFSGGEGQKPVGALKVASWVHGDSAGGARRFGVAGIIFVVDFTVGSKRDAAVGLKISVGARDDGSWTERVGDAVGMWEHVEPSDGVFDKLTLE